MLSPELPGTTLLLGQSVNAFVYTLVVCLMARAMHLFPILGLFNLTSERGKGVPCSHQVVAWYAGLRGAIPRSCNSPPYLHASHLSMCMPLGPGTQGCVAPSPSRSRTRSSARMRM